MRIVVLNECFLNDSHLKRLRALGEVQIFENTTFEDQAIERLRGADVAIMDGFVCPPSSNVLKNTNNLKLIVLPHTGYFMVDLKTANKKGVKVANAPGFSREAVAEMVIGLMFTVNRKIALMDREMREKPFDLDPADINQQRKYWGFDIKGKTMGIIGLGRIGSTVAGLALGLKMKVLANNRSPKSMNGVEMVNIEELLKRSDVVSINVTSGTDTENIISKREFGLMKRTAILINVDQGQQVDTEALYQALKEETIGGAGLDQVAGLTKDHPILKLDNVVLLPHAGSYTNESFRENLPDLVVDDIEAFAKGSPINIVD